MKKCIAVGGIVVAIMAVLVFHNKLVSSITTSKTSMDGHSVISLMTSHYSLEAKEIQELEENLNQLDNLIQKSFDEALSNKAASLSVVKTRIAHMQRVSYLAVQLMIAYEQSIGTSFSIEDAKSLMLAGYLHDIRKYAEGNHAKQGEKYVVENVPSYIKIDEDRLISIGKLIKYHSDGLSAKQRDKLGEDVILEELLQDADTVDKILNRGADEEENIEALNLQSSVDLLEQYE